MNNLIETISAMDARNRLGEMLEMAHYQNKAFSITRKDKPMAWVVGDRFMTAFFNLLEADKALQETLEIMLDAETMHAISEGAKEYTETGITYSLDDLTKD